MGRVLFTTPWLVCVVAVAACASSDGDHASDGAGPDAGPRGGSLQSDGSRSDASTSTEPCPSGTLAGDYIVASEDDLAIIASCTEISGDLTVTGDVGPTTFAALETIGGSLSVVDTTSLTSIELPALETVGNTCEIDGNAELVRFSAPALGSCPALLLANNAALTDVDVSALSDCSFVGLQQNAALTRFSAPRIETLSLFTVIQNPVLTSISFEALTSITIDGFILSMNPMLTTMNLPLLTMVAGDILIDMSPMLPTCQVDMLRAQIDDPTLPIIAYDTDESATCP